MQITDVKIRKLFDDESPMKAVASVTFDGQLALHDVKVIFTKDKCFVVMPNKRNPDGTFRDIAHPISSEFRAIVEDEVLKAYYAALEEKESAAEEE